MKKCKFKKGDTAYRMVRSADGYTLQECHIYAVRWSGLWADWFVLTEGEWGDHFDLGHIFHQDDLYKLKRNAELQLSIQMDSHRAFFEERDRDYANRESVEEINEKYAKMISDFENGVGKFHWGQHREFIV